MRGAGPGGHDGLLATGAVTSPCRRREGRGIGEVRRAPLERLVFFIVIPLCGLLTYETVGHGLGVRCSWAIPIGDYGFGFARVTLRRPGTAPRYGEPTMTVLDGRPRRSAVTSSAVSRSAVSRSFIPSTDDAQRRP